MLHSPVVNPPSEASSPNHWTMGQAVKETKPTPTLDQDQSSHSFVPLLLLSRVLWSIYEYLAASSYSRTPEGALPLPLKKPQAWRGGKMWPSQLKPLW